jgi:hypothetical protein
MLNNPQNFNPQDMSAFYIPEQKTNPQVQTSVFSQNNAINGENKPNPYQSNITQQQPPQNYQGQGQLFQQFDK